MRRFFVSLAAVLLLGGFLVWWFSPTQVVKRRTKDLLEILTLEEGTAPMSRMRGSFQLDRLLAKEVTISVPSAENANGNFDKMEVTSAYQWLCNSAKETRLTLERFDSIEIAGNQATVSASLDALVDLKSYRPIDGRGELILVWRKSENGWVLEKGSWRATTP